MNARERRIAGFLAANGWAEACRLPLAGDASLRRYERLNTGDRRAILMDAPPETGEDVRPFLEMADWLTARGASAPAILAADAEAGLLLLEDLGDDLLARHARAFPEDEPHLYATAAETLAALQDAPPPDRPSYIDDMPELAATVVDWYAPDARDRRDAIRDAMADIAARHLTGPQVFVHRDYHAENLLWLPERRGTGRIGLLDFQDAMRGPGEYDLASLIHDPRRDVSAEAVDAATRAYLDRTGAAAEGVAARIAICSVQRSLRIIGRVFTRLCLHSGRTSYLRFIPPTWDTLQRELAHPALASLRRVLDGALPTPDAAWLADTASRAGTRDGRDHAGPA
ncbi:phosphotransferase [Jannaschia sp. S6380]|uniref:aminoglycoside phosphotransferase family protein n=1 Tax=Jannaschia sp. S6380 TaxID=2926408 RepID=UPI001FF5E5EA|nr:phosphotransferase [Jannaschia sp. S6380]MCK0168839.1 phosphotransferase [Jannaschia sp. S6380]